MNDELTMGSFAKITSNVPETVQAPMMFLQRSRLLPYIYWLLLSARTLAYVPSTNPRRQSAALENQRCSSVHMTKGGVGGNSDKLSWKKQATNNFETTGMMTFNLPAQRENTRKRCGSTSSLCELATRCELDEPQDIQAARAGGMSHDRSKPSDLNLLDQEPPKKKQAGLIAWKDLKSTRYIGEGAFCSVHGAQLEGNLVAVKLLKAEHECDEVAIGDIELERELLKEMSHEHVLKMIGHGRHLHRPFIVVERLECSLSDKLKGTQSGIFFSRTSRAPLPLPSSLDYAKQLAKAMVYIHYEAFPGHHLLHRDLKPDNIGIARDGRLVLLDFGLSKLIPASADEDFCPVDMTGKTGSARYMAPEVGLSMPYNTKADVYSFSMILYAMVANRKPFGGMEMETLISDVFIAGARPPLSRKWPTALRMLLTDCWRQNPKGRPNFRSVLQQVEDLLAACEVETAN